MGDASKANPQQQKPADPHGFTGHCEVAASSSGANKDTALDTSSVQQVESDDEGVFQLEMSGESEDAMSEIDLDDLKKTPTVVTIKAAGPRIPGGIAETDYSVFRQTGIPHGTNGRWGRYNNVTQPVCSPLGCAFAFKPPSLAQFTRREIQLRGHSSPWYAYQPRT